MILGFPSIIGTFDDGSVRSQLREYLIYCLEYFHSCLLGLKNYLVNTVEHFILGCLIYLVICVILYLFANTILPFSRDMRHAKRILFIIAHPDDEVMFFGPTILHYTQKPNCTVYLMCLSSGKNYGMHIVRTNELYESCKVLGINDENIYVYNHTDLPDAMDVRWPLEIISKRVQFFVEVYGITNIVTFDRHGISGHQNHSSIYYAIANLILDKQIPKTCGVFVLETVNKVRKYWLFLDLPISFIMSRFRYMAGFIQRYQIQSALRKHTSQMVWYRKMYMHFSRYLLINTLQQMNLVDIELDLLDED